MTGECVLCTALRDEPSIYADVHISVLDCLEVKGHKVRMMVVSKKHVAVVPLWLEKYMVERLEVAGTGRFPPGKWVIMSPFFSRIQEHAHFVACDLVPEAKDYFQVMATPWVRVIDSLPRGG